MLLLDSMVDSFYKCYTCSVPEVVQLALIIIITKILIVRETVYVAS